MKKKSRTIRISEEVFKALLKLSRDFTDTLDRILRRILNIDKKPEKQEGEK